MQKAKFLIFCMIFVGSGAFAQQIHAFQAVKLSVKDKKKTVNKTFFKSEARAPAIFSFVSADFYTSQLGYFCQQELRLEQFTKIPFKFRLGSVQQCDWMEGKRYTVYYKQ